MLERAGRALPARGVLDAARRRAVHLGHAAGLHRHDRPAGPGAARERRVRPRPRGVPRRPRRLGDAAELLRRRRRRHPRGRPPDRQGRPRAGRPVLDADRHAAPAPSRAALARTSVDAAPRDGADEGRGAQGRPVARAQVSLRSGARVEDALRAARPRGRPDRRRRRPRRPAARRAAGRRVRRAARARRRGRHRAGAARARRRAVHRRRGAVGLHPLHGQGRWPSTSCATPGCRRPTSTRSARRRSRSSARPRAAGDRGAARLPDRRQAGRPGLGARDQVRAHAPATCPPAIVAAFSYDTKVLLERYVAGRDLAVSVLDGPTGRRRCRSSRRSRTRRTSTTSRRATRSAARRSCARPTSAPEATARAQELALAAYAHARLLRASPAST